MHKLKILLLFVLFFFKLSAADSIEGFHAASNTECEVDSALCSSCIHANGEGESPVGPTVIILLLITGFSYFQFKKKYILLLGGLLTLGVGTYVWSSRHVTDSDPECSSLQDTTSLDVFFEAGDDFIAKASAGDEFISNEQIVNDEFSSSEFDEFAPINDDEFSSDLDEFSNANATASGKELREGQVKHIRDLLIILLVLIVVRLFKHHARFRSLRPLFLLGGLVWLGFYHGACPCMISSFQNTELYLLGMDISWVSTLWFLGLIPVTYLLGKVWCGWFCHLGALQEFLFSATKLERLKTASAQKTISIIQYSVFVVLVVQVVITRTNLFIHYDPFKVAFNMYSANTTGYILLALLLLSTLFIYRPFCRMFCPVGLVLDWVQLIPGARKINKNENCNDCVKCSNACKSNAIQIFDKKTIIKSSGCTACGECIDSCNQEALNFTKRSMKTKKEKSKKIKTA